MYDGVIVSSGDVDTVDGVVTFTVVGGAADGETFTADIYDDRIANLNDVVFNDGTESNFPQLGNASGQKHGTYEKYPFLQLNASTLRINVYGRGDGTEFTPDNPLCDTWDLQEAGRGAFPIGKWVNLDTEEYLLFTDATVMTVSEYFDTYIYDYTINDDDNILILTTIALIPYIPTQQEVDYISNFISEEANFKAVRPWVANSTINPKTTKVRNYYTAIDNPSYNPGNPLGIDFDVKDDINVGFINDTNVIGTWNAVDRVDDYSTYDPEYPERPWSKNWESIKFEADGVFSFKRPNNNWSLHG